MLRSKKADKNNSPARLSSVSARPSSARLGSAWPRPARLGSLRLDFGRERISSARLGWDRLGSAGHGSSQAGSDRLSPDWPGTVQGSVLILFVFFSSSIAYGNPDKTNDHPILKDPFRQLEEILPTPDEKRLASGAPEDCLTN